MQIEVKTAAPTTNPNFNTIWDAIEAAGYKATLHYGGKYNTTGIVSIHTDAPRSVLDGVKYTQTAVTIRD